MFALQLTGIFHVLKITAATFMIIGAGCGGTVAGRCYNFTDIALKQVFSFAVYLSPYGFTGDGSFKQNHLPIFGMAQAKAAMDEFFNMVFLRWHNRWRLLCAGWVDLDYSWLQGS